MARFWVNCAVVLFAVSGCLGLPQGRGERRQQKATVQQQDAVPAAANLDPVAIDQNMNDEHAKLIENLQRLKRTLDTVKERVGKGSYGEQSSGVDMKNPEGAILAVLKSLQEQGQLFAMINDMLKAGSEIQNQTQKIQDFSKLAEQARAESVIAEHTNQLTTAPEATKAEAPKSATLPSPSVGPTDLTGPGPIASASRAPSTTYRKGSKQSGETNPSKQHGYDDYQYQYSDDSGHATGDDQYDYHYDAQGYDAPRSRATTTTTTTRPPSRRVRGRSRSEYY